MPTNPDGLLAAIYRLVEDPACAPILVGDTVQGRAFILIDGMLQTLQPAELRAALYQALAKIPGVTVAHGATDAAGRRGVAYSRPAATEGPGPSHWLRLEIILDSDTYHYLGARHVVTRDHASVPLRRVRAVEELGDSSLPLKAGPAGGRLRRPSSAGTAAGRSRR